MEDGFSKRLRQAIEEQGFRQRDFAIKAEITLTALSNYLTAKSMPSTEALIRIAAALDVTTDYLLTGREPLDSVIGSMRIERKLDELLRKWDLHFRDGDEK